jgi:hypothetical protein
MKKSVYSKNRKAYKISKWYSARGEQFSIARNNFFIEEKIRLKRREKH